MTDIKRYLVSGSDFKFIQHSSGYYVEFKDHAAIVDEKDARIAALQEQVRAVNALITEFWLTRHLVNYYVVTPYMTDALNKIRAEGVCILTGKIQQLIDEGTFDAKEIGVAAGVVYEGAQIADKLRAGEQP